MNDTRGDFRLIYQFTLFLLEEMRRLLKNGMPSEGRQKQLLVAITA
jgi:hypothetical protein